MKRFILIAALALAPAAAAAHSWYPGICCSGTDCDVIGVDAVSYNKATGAYVVTIVPGEHFAVPVSYNGGKPFEAIFTGEPKSSPDGQNHACVVGLQGGVPWIRCLWLGRIG